MPQFNCLQRELGEGRGYLTMWRKYKRRVLLAMSSQAFAQLVCCSFRPNISINAFMVCKNGINGTIIAFLHHLSLTSTFIGSNLLLCA